MKNVITICLLFLSSYIYAGTYYNLQHYKITPDTTNIRNDIYFRGDFHLTDDTSTVNISSCAFPLILYASGTIHAKTVESDNSVYLSTTVGNSLALNGYSYEHYVNTATYQTIGGSKTWSNSQTFRSTFTVIGSTTNSYLVTYSTATNGFYDFSVATTGVVSNPKNSYITLKSTGSDIRLGDTVETKLYFTAVTDTQSEYSSTTGSITVKNDGTYTTNATFYIIDLASGDTAVVLLYKNGTILRQSVTTTGGAVCSATLHCTDQLSSGDSLGLRIIVNSSAGSVYNSAAYASWWTLQKIN